MNTLTKKQKHQRVTAWMKKVGINSPTEIKFGKLSQEQILDYHKAAGNVIYGEEALYEK